MESFLNAPNEASIDTLVDAYNTVIKWVKDGDDRIHIAEAILHYMSKCIQYQNVYKDIYLALAEICYIQKDYDKNFDYIMVALQYDPYHENAYVKLIDVIPIINNVDKFLDILPLLKKEVKYYDILMIHIFEYTCQHMRLETAHKILAYFSSIDVRELYEKTHNLIVPYTLAHELEDKNSFLETTHKYTKNPTSLRHFIQTNKCILLRKFGFHLTYMSDYDKMITKVIAQFYRAVFPFVDFTSVNITNELQRNTKKIKIGFISAFLRDHTIGKMFGGVIKALNRNMFEIYLYQINTTSEIFKPYVDHFINLKHNIEFEQNIKEWQRDITNKNLDILVYPELGMDLLVYLMSFSKLARVQLVWWGHPESPCTNIDYFISSKVFNDRPEQYHEKLLKMDSSSVIYPRPLAKPDPQKTREVLGLPKNIPIYMCIQTFFKYTNVFDDAIIKILQRDPNALVVIVDALNLSYYKDMLSKRWQLKMSESLWSRIKFASNRSTLDDLLSLVQHANVMLDTFPFSGSTTHLECFSIGKPVITMNGSDLRGSLCTGLYRRLGILNAPIAQTVDEYADIAVRLANNQDECLTLEKHILDAMETFYDAEEEKQEWNDLLYEIATTKTLT